MPDTTFDCPLTRRQTWWRHVWITRQPLLFSMQGSTPVHNTAALCPHHWWVQTCNSRYNYLLTYLTTMPDLDLSRPLGSSSSGHLDDATKATTRLWRVYFAYRFLTSRPTHTLTKFWSHYKNVDVVCPWLCKLLKAQLIRSFLPVKFTCSNLEFQIFSGGGPPRKTTLSGMGKGSEKQAGVLKKRGGERWWKGLEWREGKGRGRGGNGRKRWGGSLSPKQKFTTTPLMSIGNYWPMIVHLLSLIWTCRHYIIIYLFPLCGTLSSFALCHGDGWTQ